MIRPGGGLRTDLAAERLDKAIGCLTDQEQAKIFSPQGQGFEDSLAQNTEVVLPPEAVVAERIAGSDSDDAMQMPVPDPAESLVLPGTADSFQDNGTGEDNSKIDPKIR